MPLAERHAEVVWKGDLEHGRGVLESQSGALVNMPVTWASRVEQPNGQSSPEELIAAAQATCYAMSLANTLAKRGTPAVRLDVGTTIAIERVAGRLKITTNRITASGEVPGVDEATFRQAAEQAENGCPVTNALRGNVEIHLEAHLQPVGSRS